jgi:uncharacterized Fe-S cluster protein YjdI
MPISGWIWIFSSRIIAGYFKEMKIQNSFLINMSKKEYSNEEITIIWESEKCIPSGICVKTLPKVYHLQERPWIKIGNATSEELMNQINLCPSGALSYKKLK